VSDSELLAAYLATVWSVEGPDGVLEVRPGRIAPPPLRPSAIVTAYNPASQQRSADENDRADAALRARIADAGWASWRTLARGTGDDAGAWDEPGWLLRGDARDFAIQLGVEFGQNAIVWIDAEGEVTIVTTRDGFCGAAVGEVVG